MCELPTGFAVSTTLNCLADTPSRLPNRHRNHLDDHDNDGDDDVNVDDDEFEKDRRTWASAELFLLCL